MNYDVCEWAYCRHKARWHLSVRTRTGGKREAKFCTGHAVDAMSYPACEWTRFERIAGSEDEE